MERSKIMVVEDERIVALALEEQLGRAGYSVVGSVGSGKEAVETARETLPDVILMDIRLAGEMDGIEAAARIAEFCDASVIFLTAYSDDELVARASEVLPYGFLLKPIADRALRPAIEVALSRRASDGLQAERVISALDTVLEELKPTVESLSEEQALAICSVCQRARTRGGRWTDLATKLMDQIGIEYQTEVCDDCQNLPVAAPVESGPDTESGPEDDR